MYIGINYIGGIIMNNLKSYLIPVSESLSKDYITKKCCGKIL